MTKPTPKLEACARALCAVNESDWETLPESWGSAGPHYEGSFIFRNDYREFARAVISELMEPSEEMIEAGWKAQALQSIYPLKAFAAFRAMLKAVLEERDPMTNEPPSRDTTPDKP